MTLENNFKQPIPTSIFWGIIGGVALIAATKLTTSGYSHILPYVPVLFCATLANAVANKSNVKFGRLFVTGLLTFLLMSLVLYVFIGVFINPNSEITIKGHTLRLLAMIAIGALSSLVVSVIVKIFAK